MLHKRRPPGRFDAVRLPRQRPLLVEERFRSRPCSIKLILHLLMAEVGTDDAPTCCLEVDSAIIDFP